jgi:PAS domain S-box-containing protein
MNRKKVLHAKISSRSIVIFSGFILGLIFIYFASFLTHQHMENSKKQRLDHLRQVVQIARNSIEPILVEFRNKTVTKEMALEQIRTLVRRMTYEDHIGGNYIFMSSYDGIMLVQPFEPDMEMTTAWDLKDFEGVYIIRALVDAAKSKDGQGYVSYHYQRPGQKTAEEKISFVIGIPGLECYIGTGQYVSDLRKSQFNYVAKIAGLTAILLLLLLFLVRAAIRELRTQNNLLCKAEHELSAIFNNTYQLMGTLSPDGTLIKINRSALKIIDKDENSLVGRPFWDTPWWPDDEVKSRLKKAVADCANGAFCRFEATHIRADKEKAFIDFSLTPIFDENEDVLFLLAEGRDMTARVKAIEHNKNLEEMLSQSQKMESIGTLAGGIAHDFNNIIAAVLGYSELTLTDKTLNSKARENLNQVVVAAQRAKELTMQILTFSRKGGEDKLFVQAHLIVEEAIKLLRKTIPTTVEIHTDISKENDTVYADTTQLHQVVMNLCTNANHALKTKGGSISMSLSTVEVNATLASSIYNLNIGWYVKFSVTDDGEGMSAETCSKIFEPFFTTKKTGEGTGMGMAVVHGIIKNHRGAISIDSSLGEGTRVDIYIPFSPKESTNTVSEVGSLPTGTESILVVDDEPALAEMTSKVLQGLGYTADCMTSSRSALSEFKQTPNKYDLVISDQTMPVMPGSTLATEILRLRPELPIIICTGYSETINEEQAREIGIKVLINKPLDRALLAKVVRESLDSASAAKTRLSNSSSTV